jgi:hypothetical protein
MGLASYLKIWLRNALAELSRERSQKYVCLALCLPVSLQKLITNILALWMICGGSTDGCHFCILIFLCCGGLFVGGTQRKA